MLCRTDVEDVSAILAYELAYFSASSFVGAVGYYISFVGHSGSLAAAIWT